MSPIVTPFDKKVEFQFQFRSTQTLTLANMGPVCKRLNVLGIAYCPYKVQRSSVRRS